MIDFPFSKKNAHRRAPAMARRSILTGRKASRFMQFVVTENGATRGEVFGLAGALFEGRFQIEKRIAEGGFAVVYRAWQLTLERWVALKILKAPRSYDDIGR